MVEKRNVVAEAGCTSGCDIHHLDGVRFLDSPHLPYLDSLDWVPFSSLFVSEVAPELVDCTRITNYHLPDVEQIDSKGKV